MATLIAEKKFDEDVLEPERYLTVEIAGRVPTATGGGAITI